MTIKEAYEHRIRELGQEYAAIEHPAALLAELD